MLSFLKAKDDRLTRIKICGITRPEDAKMCIDLGVDALGINFWPTSKRYVGELSELSWLQELQGEIPRVGVFVNAEIEDVEDLLALGFIDVAQFHGDEPSEYLAHFAEWELNVIKAIGVAKPESLADVTKFETKHFLLDAYCPGEYGGSGKTFDWDLARTFIDEHPDYQVMLAGGLTKDNLSEAISSVRPAAVDIAGGSESAPGIKDRELVAALVEAIKK